jgi:hypothetical protein
VEMVGGVVVGGVNARHLGYSQRRHVRSSIRVQLLIVVGTGNVFVETASVDW